MKRSIGPICRLRGSRRRASVRGGHYQQKYEEIVADYNREKDRVTIEETFRRLMELIEELDAEQRRAVEEGLSEDELALFDLVKKEDLGKAAQRSLQVFPRRRSATAFSTALPMPCRP